MPRTLIILHSKAQFLLGTKCTKLDSTFYSIILNIKRFKIALKCFLVQIGKNGNNVNIVMAITLNAVSGNRP